jgi:putative FmdB family regulatory protein
MPTYDYQCQKCGHRYEVFQSMKDDRLTDCPLETCDGSVKRLLGTGAGIIFKGSGFYETDYRSDSYKKAASADKSTGGGGGSESSSSSGASGDSKPAAAPPAPAATPSKSDS